MIDFNYDTEPLAGKYPVPGIGPFTLLERATPTTGASSGSAGPTGTFSCPAGPCPSRR